MKYILILCSLLLVLLTACSSDNSSNVINNTTKQYHQNITITPSDIYEIEKGSEDERILRETMEGYGLSGLLDKDCQLEVKDTTIEFNTARCVRCKDLTKSLIPGVIGKGEWFCP